MMIYQNIDEYDEHYPYGMNNMHGGMNNMHGGGNNMHGGGNNNLDTFDPFFIDDAIQQNKECKSLIGGDETMVEYPIQ